MHGAVGYLEIPTTDAERSADFYRRAFGWNVERRGDATPANGEPGGEVIGAWVRGRPTMAEPGLRVDIGVESVASSLEAVLAAGGELVQPIGEAPEITARFRDPAGNVLGLYQERGG